MMALVAPVFSEGRFFPKNGRPSAKTPSLPFFFVQKVGNVGKRGYLCGEKMIVMDKDEQKDYWLELADYDMVTAQAMYDTKRWLYVGFMCHQVLEKSMKAYWCSTKPEDPPYSHNLMSLYQSTNLSRLMNEDQVIFISQMMPMNIESRYPSYKDRLFRSLTPENCKQMLDTTKEFLVWIKSKL